MKIKFHVTKVVTLACAICLVILTSACSNVSDLSIDTEDYSFRFEESDIPVKIVTKNSFAYFSNTVEIEANKIALTTILSLLLKVNESDIILLDEDLMETDFKCSYQHTNRKPSSDSTVLNALLSHLDLNINLQKGNLASSISDSTAFKQYLSTTSDPSSSSSVTRLLNSIRVTNMPLDKILDIVNESTNEKVGPSEDLEDLRFTFEWTKDKIGNVDDFLRNNFGIEIEEGLGDTVYIFEPKE